MIRRFEIMFQYEYGMHPLFRSAPMIAVVLAAAISSQASAQSQATTQNQQDLKARCNQLISYYDRYGSSRGENSDGARNFTRIGAGVDCEKGRYQDGIAAMEALLKQKSFEVPPPPTGVAQSPSSGGARSSQ